MHHVARAAILLVGLSALTAAQNFAHLDHRSPSLKFDREKIIGWDQLSRNGNSSQVYLYNRQGNLLTKISLPRLVPEATVVAIDDAAITPSGILVIAADYSRGKGTLASSMLLYFDFDGQLLSAASLLPSRQISRLAADEDSNIWTLTENAARKNPSSVPMLVQYDTTGNALRELLKRSDFPTDADINSDDIGTVGFGYQSGSVWFWLPGSQDLVTVDVSRGTFTKLHTGLPNKFPAETVMAVFRDSTGLTARIHEAASSGARGTWGIFRWSLGTQSWADAQPSNCGHKNHLMGLENGRGIFAGPASGGGMDICISDF